MADDFAIADTLLSYSSNAQYLLSRLAAEDETWAKVTNGYLMKMGREFGPYVVLEALQEIRMRLPKVRSPAAYLRGVCVGLSRRNATSGALSETASHLLNDDATRKGIGDER